MKTYTADLIECAAGWQVEISLPGGWSTCSRVYPTKEQARDAANRVAKIMKWNVVFSDAEINNVKEAK